MEKMSYGNLTNFHNFKEMRKLYHGGKILILDEKRYDDENGNLYNLILKEWINYHENESSSLERKLDKFLETVEILPGGEEYEKSKLNFENIIS